MRILVMFCHPSPESFGAALFNAAQETLTAHGHDLRVIDLYRAGFDPVLAPAEWDNYLNDTERVIENIPEHVDALLWAESLLLIFPTWMYGPPALLKGWFERVLLPGVAFDISENRNRRIVGRLDNIRSFTVITTSGSPWWWLRLIRDPGRSMLTRGIRVLFHRRCRVRWLQLHDMNHQDDAGRRKFLARVRAALAKL